MHEGQPSNRGTKGSVRIPIRKTGNKSLVMQNYTIQQKLTLGAGDGGAGELEARVDETEVDGDVVSTLFFLEVVCSSCSTDLYDDPSVP